jgi:hypothetical protein
MISTMFLSRSSQVKSTHKQQTTKRKPIECAPEASWYWRGRESMELTMDDERYTLTKLRTCWTFIHARLAARNGIQLAWGIHSRPPKKRPSTAAVVNAQVAAAAEAADTTATPSASAATTHRTAAAAAAV